MLYNREARQRNRENGTIAGEQVWTWCFDTSFAVLGFFVLSVAHMWYCQQLWLIISIPIPSQKALREWMNVVRVERGAGWSQGQSFIRFRSDRWEIGRHQNQTYTTAQHWWLVRWWADAKQSVGNISVLFALEMVRMGMGDGTGNGAQGTPTGIGHIHTISISEHLGDGRDTEDTNHIL